MTASGPKGKRLWGAFSSDAGATWSKNVMLYEVAGGTICECCHPSLAAAGHGEFVVMWRNALEGSRDMYTMRLRDGRVASGAEKQGVGTWKLEACPMDGGGLVLRNQKIASAWRREKDVYLAETGKPEIKLGTGQDVALGANNQGLYVVWSTADGIMAHLPNATQPSKLAARARSRRSSRCRMARCWWRGKRMERSRPRVFKRPLLAFAIAMIATIGAIALAQDRGRYPAHWWAPVAEDQKASWEVLPQAARPGEVILSKRNELGILSNFAATPFTFRGKRYASVEGFWQMML